MAILCSYLAKSLREYYCGGMGNGNCPTGVRVVYCIVLVGGFFIFVVRVEYVCTVWIDGNESIELDVTRAQRSKYPSDYLESKAVRDGGRGLVMIAIGRISNMHVTLSSGLDRVV